MEPVLEVKNLTKIFKRGGQEDLAAVKNVSFCLYPGEILGIVGESGSGKSTAARMITRLIKADSGRFTSGFRWCFSRRLHPLIRGVRWETGSVKVCETAGFPDRRPDGRCGNFC